MFSQKEVRWEGGEANAPGEPQVRPGQNQQTSAPRIPRSGLVQLV